MPLAIHAILLISQYGRPHLSSHVKMAQLAGGTAQSATGVVGLVGGVNKLRPGRHNGGWVRLWAMFAVNEEAVGRNGDQWDHPWMGLAMGYDVRGKVGCGQDAVSASNGVRGWDQHRTGHRDLRGWRQTYNGRGDVNGTMGQDGRQ